jgi:hypothetical protein
MNSIKKSLEQPQISGFGLSAEVQIGIIQRDGDINILFTHRVCKHIFNNGLSKLFQGGN